MMSWGRRAYIFSIVSLVVLMVVIGGISYKQASDARQTGLHTHITQANHFLEQLETDVPRALHITGYRSLLGLEEHISSTGAYLDNLTAAFSEVMTNGSVNGTGYGIMENATLGDYEARVQAIAGSMGVELDISIARLAIEHVSPLRVRVDSTIRVNATTRDATTRWDYNTTVSSIFSIEQLKDPLYAVGTLGRVPAIIAPVNQSRPYIDAGNDTTRLQIIYNNTQYRPDPAGPSFLMRFVGDLSASPHGIASLVSTEELDAQDLPVHTDRSIVDFLYFGTSPTSTNCVVNMPEEFLLDDAHLDDYDATGKTVSC